MDEESLKRVKAKLETDAANGVKQEVDTDGFVAIPGGVDVTSSITANVWEVHVKVSAARPVAARQETGERLIDWLHSYRPTRACI